MLQHYKCPNCFFCYEKEIDVDYIVTLEMIKYISQKCDYCKNYPEMGEHNRVKRILSILDKCLLSDYPTILRLIYWDLYRD